jgi:hypothetical protein
MTDTEYYDSQFQESGQEKNILFVRPELSGKHLYRYIIPYFSLCNDNINTAITGLEKYETNYITTSKMVLKPAQVVWADYIVFPFTTRDLTDKRRNVYETIRNINPKVKIVYCVDFNYYELSTLHPYYNLFTNEAISAVDDNIFFSDICLVSNLELQKFLAKKMKEYMENKYREQNTSLKISTMPFIFDAEIMLQNVDFEPEQAHEVFPEQVHIEREKISEIKEVAQEVKKKDLETKKNKSNGKSTTKSTRQPIIAPTPTRGTGKSDNGESKVGAKPKSVAPSKRTAK